MKIKYYHIVLVSIIFSSCIAAQDSTSSAKNYLLDEITIISDKLNTKLADSPTNIEIIDEKEIESINGNTLPDILNTKANVFIKSYGLTPALSTISINGLGAEHTLIVVDGVKLNSFQNSHIDLSLIPINNIERIEIINNGVSSIYGSDALGGVVNIILKNKEILDKDRTTKYSASISQGSYKTIGYSINVYKELQKFNLGINYEKESSDGNYKYYFNSGNGKILKERENAAYALYNLGLRTQYIIDNENVIKFFSTYSDQDKQVPGIETGTTPAPTKQLDKNWNNILTIDNNLSENFYLKTNLNFQNNFMDYSVGRFLHSSYKNLVYLGSSELRFKEENYGITSGYSFSHATLESGELLDGIKRSQHALFLSSFYNFNKLIKIYPSARYDYISDISEETLTYKLGLNLQPLNKSQFGIRGNIGKNFRAPSFNDLYWINSGNKNLKSEKSFNLESGFYYWFSNFISGKFDFTYTFISAENKIVWSPQSNGLWAPQNIAKSISNNYSFSLNIEKTFSEKFSVNLNSGLQLTNTKKTSSSYQNDPTENKFIPYIPLQAINLNLGLNYGLFELNIFYSHCGKHYSDFANINEMDPYNTIDGNISFEINVFDIITKLKFEVNNITNSEYEVISGYPMPLRYYKLTFSINF